MQKKIICAESSHIIMPLMVPSAKTFAANACYVIQLGLTFNTCRPCNDVML